MATTIFRCVGGCFMAAVSVVACAKASPRDSQPSTPPAAPVEAAPSAAGQAGTAPAVNADARALAAFQARIAQYVELRGKLLASLPKLSKDSTPEQIDKHQRDLAALILSSRRGAKPGDIFTGESRAVIRRLLARVFGDADGRQLRNSIMDENPGPLSLTVNGRYPDNVPLATMPPQVLEGLPKLPRELEFRFLGPRLILMDVPAHVVVDWIEDALPR